MSDYRKAVVSSMLIRRLARERPEIVAREISELDCWTHLELLTPEDVPAIIAASKGASVEVQEVCYELLAAIETPEAQECLAERLSGPKDSAWLFACQGLAETRPAKVPQALLAAVTGDRRWDILPHIGKFRDPVALEFLLNAARDSESEVRVKALEGLASFPGKESEKTSQTALKDSDLEVREQALSTLGKIGTGDSVPEIVEVLRQPDANPAKINGGVPTTLHEEAGRALACITKQDFGSSAAAWEEWWKQNSGTFDMRKILMAELTAPLRPYAGGQISVTVNFGPYHGTYEDKQASLDAILNHNFRELAPKLAQLLKDRNGEPLGRMLAAQALRAWGYREGIDEVIEMMKYDLPRPGWTELPGATGVNFFSDMKRWKNWWEANREKFPSALDASGT